MTFYYHNYYFFSFFFYLFIFFLVVLLYFTHKSRHIYIMKEMLYEVRCLKSNEDMILALAGQFKQLSHEPEKLYCL